MKKINLMLFMVLCHFFSFGQNQNPFWAFPNSMLNFTGGTPSVNTGCTSNFGAPLNYLQTPGGNQFYVDANNIGYCSAPINYSGANGNENSERVIIPVPEICGQYYLVYPDYVTSNSQDIYWLKYDATNNSIVQGPVLMATNTGARIGLAAAPVGTNSFTYLYTVMPNAYTASGSSVWGLAKWMVTSTGITFDSNLHNSFTNRDKYSPIEADLSHNGGKIAWGNPITVPSSKANVFEYDNNTAILTTHYVGATGYRVSGVEYTSSGKLYASARGCNGCGPQGGIYQLTGTGSGGPFGGSSYNRSMLELGYSPSGDEYIYSVNNLGTYLGYIRIADNSFAANAVAVNGIKHRNVSDIYILPDQIDGNDYSMEYSSVNITASALSICLGDNVTLTVTEPGSYTWNTGQTGTSITVTPTTTGIQTYTVTGVNVNGCQIIGSVSITVNSLPSASLSDVVLCANDGFPVHLSTNPRKGYTYSWTHNGNPVSGTSLIGTFNGYYADVNMEGEYCVIVTNILGCKDTACATVEYDYRLDFTPEFNLTTYCNPGGTTYNVLATFDQLPAWPEMCYWWKVCEIDANGNEVYCLTNPSQWWVGGTSQDFSPEFTFEKDKIYRITRAIWSCGDGCIPWQAYSATFSCSTSRMQQSDVTYRKIPDNEIAVLMNSVLESNADENMTKLYPNPVTSNVNIEIGYLTDARLEIMDVTGKLIQVNNLQNGVNTISLDELTKGIYLFKVFEEGQLISTEKVIKQ